MLSFHKKVVLEMYLDRSTSASTYQHRPTRWSSLQQRLANPPQHLANYLSGATDSIESDSNSKNDSAAEMGSAVDVWVPEADMKNFCNDHLALILWECCNVWDATCNVVVVPDWQEDGTSAAALCHLCSVSFPVLDLRKTNSQLLSYICVDKGHFSGSWHGLHQILGQPPDVVQNQPDKHASAQKSAGMPDKVTLSAILSRLPDTLPDVQVLIIPVILPNAR